jgi:hypothetical protein
MFLIASLTFAIGLSSSPATAGIEDQVYPPHSSPLGRAYPEWIASWLTWGLSAPTATNPFLHPDDCDFAGQVVDGAAFLAGSGGGHVRVNCTIPANTPILVLPGVSAGILGIDGDTRAEVREAVLDDVAGFHGVKLRVDGHRVRPINRWLTRTNGFFDLELPEDNIIGLPPGNYSLFSKGSATMLRPLAVGEHKIYTQAFFGDGTKASVTYHLTVA